MSRIRLRDVDDFILGLTKRLRAKTIAGISSVIRAFLRFLHATGRIAHDLSPSVIAPRVKSGDRPPRALPWPDVRRVLTAIDTNRPLGLRDFAALLMMALYGMGAGEVLGLRLEDVDWRRRVLAVRRPKTGQITILPLLPPVARALAAYLRNGRPRHAKTRAIFVSGPMPHVPMTRSALWHRLREFARIAGVKAAFLGTHALRHSHACRQIEQGTNPKVLSDILGHGRPTSTSPYVRVAMTRLRALALPVPR
jgi:integrase